MEMILSGIVTGITTLIFFSLVPFIWWLIRHRKKISFIKWIGLVKPKLNSKWWVLIIFAVVYYFFYTFDFTAFISEESMEAIATSDTVAANKYAGVGVLAIVPAIFTNIIGNGFGEEILFRGFLNKRLCNKLGAIKGSALQAILFAGMHNVLYLVGGAPVGLDFHFWMFIFTGAGALLLGLLNEKIFNGSIIPSALVHGAGNFWGTIRVAFNLF